MTEKIIKILESYESLDENGNEYIKPKDYNSLASKLLEAINYTRCSTQLKDKNSTTIKEYATELLDIEENPNNSNKEWKKVVIENTITKLQEVIQTL